jgi:arsenate reductase-like glutaredoxin family protein
MAEEKEITLRVQMTANELEKWLGMSRQRETEKAARLDLLRTVMKSAETNAVQLAPADLARSLIEAYQVVMTGFPPEILRTEERQGHQIVERKTASQAR